MVLLRLTQVQVMYGPYLKILTALHIHTVMYMRVRSGHILEFDDTPDKERILLYHHSGTETEITVCTGTKNEVNKDSTNTITEKDNKVYIKGSSDLTIGGRHKIMLNADGAANNHYDIQVGI